MINNEIRNWQGRSVGFKCIQCGGVYSQMWGNVCNKCRAEERRHQELINALNKQR